ncbi:Succinate dehydrogenase [Actinidia chinensis var. chinensis]|uniref:Succinate dehydrogenase n=1 Tax=Actinidia chinensis var. chinensis TaxID=1590841 RepID=A0A2R6QP17_ACTCC|nr:Succinate dehydrogenase [Actinidia chinensis var. chinensis]
MMMIYRKWSLLTGPPAILGGIVATVVVANFLFVKNDPLLKPSPGKQDRDTSTK